MKYNYLGLAASGCSCNELIAPWSFKMNTEKVWVGLDASNPEEGVAVVAVGLNFFRSVNSVGWLFVPSKRIDEAREKDIQYFCELKEAIKSHRVIVCGENSVDLECVEQFISKYLAKVSHVPIVVCYDRYNAISIIENLESENIECVEIKQHSSILYPALDYLKEKIHFDWFHFLNNSFFEKHFLRLRTAETYDGHEYISKKASIGNISLVSALINALVLVRIIEDEHS